MGSAQFSQSNLPQNLADWLAYIEALHPKSIAMGLARVAQVAAQLKLNPEFPIITVGGTNGKGSTCAMLTEMYLAAGYTVGCYTSPHLTRFNERIKINGLEVVDAHLCVAFSAVETARGDTQLTYFEMGTLAAMWLFMRTNLEVCILEVGLGGRLDAVNLFDANCSIVTSIDFDHMEFLGDTRDKIGFEKAGIFRKSKPAICGDANPPQSLTRHAQQINANFAAIGQDFTAKKTTAGWQYVNKSQSKNQTLALPKPSLVGDFQLSNAACAVHAVMQLQNILPVAETSIRAGLQAVQLVGRFHTLSTEPLIIADVAHNPHAARSLAHNLETIPCAGRTFAVFGMLRDKDIAGVCSVMLPHIDSWVLADIDHARGAKAVDLETYLTVLKCQKPITVCKDLQNALTNACQAATKNDRIVVFGSFYTVAAAMDFCHLKTVK